MSLQHTEAQEVEGLRLAKAAPLAVRRRMAAELDQARLVRMQTERKAFQPLPQGRKKSLAVGLVLEAGDEIVGPRVRPSTGPRTGSAKSRNP